MFVIHEAVAAAIQSERDAVLARAEYRHRAELRAHRRSEAAGRRRFRWSRWRPAGIELRVLTGPELSEGR